MKLLGFAASSIASVVVYAASRSTTYAALVGWLALVMSVLALGISIYTLRKLTEQVDPQTEEVRQIISPEVPADREP